MAVLKTHLQCPKHVFIQLCSVQGNISEIHNFISSETLANYQGHFSVIPLH